MNECEAVLAKKLDQNRKPTGITNIFSKEDRAIYGYWKTYEKPGNAVKTVWIAVNAGDAAPPNTKIAEKAVPVPDKKDATWWDGTFALSRPTNGWPTGEYEVEVYFDAELVKTLHFFIR